jgi:hypothetical protein
MQQYDVKVILLGTTCVPDFILILPVVLEVKRADRWKDRQDQPIMLSSHAFGTKNAKLPC